MAHGIEECRSVGGQAVDPIASVGRLRVAEAALVHSEGAIVPRQQRRSLLTRTTSWPSMQEDDCFAIGITMLRRSE